MLYGIYYAYWEQEWGGDFIPYVEKVKSLGFDILEVACQKLTEASDQYLLELREKAQEAGIILTGGYGPSRAYHIADSDPAVVKAAFAKYQGIFEKMKLAGIEKLGGGLYSYWPADYSVPPDKPGDLRRSVANTRALADMAADYGITLGMEVLNRFEGYLLNTCQEAVDFVVQVDRPNVTVMLDTFHMNIEEDSFGAAIRLAGPYLGHLHVGEANRRPPFPGGRIPWEEIGEALGDIGYTGTVVMEPFVRMGGTVGRDIRVWHDLSQGCPEEKLDQDAAAAVRYLRGLWG